METITRNNALFTLEDGDEDVKSILEGNVLADLFITPRIEEESASHSELPLVCLEERPLTSVNPSDIPESISQQYSTIKETVQTNLIHVNAILENLNCFDLHPHLRTIEKTQKNLNIRVLLSLTTVNIHLHRVELTRFQ